MNRIRIPAILVGACLLAAGGAAAGDKTGGLVLVDRGAPKARIVIPAGAGDVEKRAAAILRDTVRKMSGATLPVLERRRPGGRRTVSIGFPASGLPPDLAVAASQLKADGFLLATRAGRLRIVSGGHKGAIYGVVHLLETRFGCRKLSPTAEIVPRRETLSLPDLEVHDNPVNDLRIVYGEFGLDPDYRDWLRIDVIDDFFAKGYYVHTFNALVPWETYFESHPEYYALMNGRRNKDQLCLSNPEVLRLAIETLRREMAAQPGRSLWSVSQNDNPSYCRCHDCETIIREEGSPAGPVIRFVNQVAAAFPDKTISTLAYQYSRSAPRLTKPAGNVQIMLCTIELNRSLPISADPSSASFLRDIVDWGRIASNIYLWDYTVNFSHHVSPFPNLHVLKPNIQFLVRNGARQHFQQTNTSPGHELSELKSYLLARLLWDPDVSAEAVTDEFLAAYYGPAAPWIRRYIDGLRDELLASGTRLDIYEPPTAHAEDYLSAPAVARYDGFFDRAEAAVAGEPVLLERVKTARLPLQYARLEIGKAGMFGPRGFYVERGGRFEARPEMKALVEDFAATCARNGVKTLSEAGLKPQDYRDACLRFIDVQVDKNLAFRRPVTAVPPPAAKYGRGDLAVLTNGVRGAADYKVHWLGWEGTDIDLTIELDPSAPAPREAALSTLSGAYAWILHPNRVTCSVSTDGVRYQEIRSIAVQGDHKGEELIKTFAFDWATPGVRLVRFQVEGTKRLPDWHPSAGGPSWVFVDEIVVR